MLARTAIGDTGMKIEIGEFLILSWLRHVRGCVVTQMNWSPSPAWTVARERELRATFEAVRRFSEDTIGRSSFAQVDFGPWFATPGSTCWGFGWIAIAVASRRSPSIGHQ